MTAPSRAEQVIETMHRLGGCDADLADFIASLPPMIRDGIAHSWYNFWARGSQKLPPGDWRTWFYRAGRGAGKTRSGAEALRKGVNDLWIGRAALIAPTAGDVRDVIVEGESGILASHPDSWRPVYEPSKRRLTWPNGATATCYSAEEPDRLRGPQHDWVWGDEPASWRSGRLAWDNAMLGLRIGKNPRSMLTGTPRPLDWLKELEAKPSTVVTRGSTYENAANLAPAFIELILERYEGTRLGAQELHAEYLEDTEGALWTNTIIEAARFVRFNTDDPWRSLTVCLARIADVLGRGVETFTSERRQWHTVIGVDPPGETAECGIVVGSAVKEGRAARDHAVILDDRSLAGTPEQWGAAVVKAYNDWNADLVVVEANQGSDMTRSTIHAVDPTVKVQKVRAKDSKAARAEPISTLYAKGWVHHVGNFPKLEDQMTTWVPDESKSPDRVDALVWCVTHLLKPSVIGTASLSSQVHDLAATRL